jgi:hypothetical protein
MLGSNLYRSVSYPEIFLAVTESLQANAGILPQSVHDTFLPNPFQFIIDHTIRRYDLATQEAMK